MAVCLVLFGSAGTRLQQPLLTSVDGIVFNKNFLSYQREIGVKKKPSVGGLQIPCMSTD